MSQNIHNSFIRLAEGDIGVLEEIYNALSVRIFNYARTITKNKEMSEDITHDVFVRIISLAARLATMDTPVAYIMVIARNLAYNQLKRGCATTTLDEADVAGITPTPFNVLPDAFSQLPSNQRETVYLHHICGFTQKEVSQIMRVPLVTVKWRCKKAKQHLQEYFKPNKEVQAHEVL